MDADKASALDVYLRRLNYSRADPRESKPPRSPPFSPPDLAMYNTRSVYLNPSKTDRERERERRSIESKGLLCPLDLNTFHRGLVQRLGSARSSRRIFCVRPIARFESSYRSRALLAPEGLLGGPAADSRRAPSPRRDDKSTRTPYILVSGPEGE